MRLQLRWEIFALDAADEVEGWLRMDPTPTIAFNDHFTPLLDETSRVGRDYAALAKRAGMSVEDYRDLNARTKTRAGDVPGMVARLAAAAREAGVVAFAHDETDAETRREHRALGVAVSEFPLTRDAAAEAAAHDEAIVLGAPNVVRGGSHIGALDAEPAAREGLCGALASDYFYPSLLAAATRMIGAGGWAAEDAWRLISANPARFVDLQDRGVLTEGAVADVALIDLRPGGASVDAVFRRGAPVLAATPGRIAA